MTNQKDHSIFHSSFPFPFPVSYSHTIDALIMPGLMTTSTVQGV